MLAQEKGGEDCDLEPTLAGFEPEVESTCARARCEGPCARPLSVCVCAHLPPTRIKTLAHVLVLQHPHETRHPLNTLSLLSASLSNLSLVHGRVLRRGLSPLLDSNPPKTLFFFPSPSAKPLTEWLASQGSSPYSDGGASASTLSPFSNNNGGSSDSCLYNNAGSSGSTQMSRPYSNEGFFSSSPSPCPYRNGGASGSEQSYNPDNSAGPVSAQSDPHGNGESTAWNRSSVLYNNGDSCGSPLVLIFFDGTWKHAKEMMRASLPFLLEFAEQVCFPFEIGLEGASVYSGELVLRKEPFKGCLSTMEAVARALGMVEREGKTIEEKLLGILRAAVEFQASNLKDLMPRPKLCRKGGV
ncbi:hypothetical protein AMTRI_Chr01g135720 [Amborella trichopoda]|uniref:tRNA-uridine aminocarboxypropyltransferase n=1 Tax=Amborella trichopoda TaxID=13333 RepID=W1PRR4_AMBTC|nr:uncharacterized protein LOC18440913 [Amborella trichopoda]ERN12692.1 hypothetical protein AMTR_s00025p00248900 [Amborella trichopoda]|eukprot:XP_006851111.1 uncharacterized protein LOC18440913 [Amborella trichopoda]